MNPVKLKPGNIWSGDSKLAVFTNPTELAFRKGNLKHHWPVMFNGNLYPDAEAAYKVHQTRCNFEELQELMTDIIACKLQQHPVLFETLKLSGGISFIVTCRHIVGARTGVFRRWEGIGTTSAFIRCLRDAFVYIQKGDVGDVNGYRK